MRLISIHALREEGDTESGGTAGTVAQFLSTPSARRATSRTLIKITGALLFLSTPSARRATGTSMFTTLLSGDFYPRPPRGGRPPSGRNTPDTPNFYPRPPRGGRLTARGSITPGINFYPRPPRGGRPTSAASRSVLSQFLSTPSARRATGHDLGAGQGVLISIHALREEGDLRLLYIQLSFWISIHALREEGDASQLFQIFDIRKFLSTPSARRATFVLPDGWEVDGYFYPRPPRGGRRRNPAPQPRAARFLSTPSARRATPGVNVIFVPVIISIHALREEGDLKVSPGNTSST